MTDHGSARNEVPVRSCAVAGTVGILLVCVLLLLLSAFLADQILPKGREGMAARAALVVGSFAAGWLACRGNPAARLQSIGITSGFLLIFLLLLGIFTIHTSIFNISMLMDLGCVIFGVFAGGMCTTKRRRRVRRRTRQYSA